MTEILSDFLRCAATDGPSYPAIWFDDDTLTRRQVDADSDAMAAAFQALGVRPGSRIAICLQNVPEFVTTLFAVFKAGAILVPFNPMNRAAEASALFADCGPVALVCHRDFATDVLPGIQDAPELVIVVPDGDQVADVEVAELSGEGGATTVDFYDFVASGRLGRMSTCKQHPDDVALIVYTSGTTGKPKGAMISHGNLLAGGSFYVTSAALGNGPVLGLAPLFHVTGLSGHIAAAFIAGVPLILCHRFRADVVLAAMIRRRPTFTVGAITALSALIDHPSFVPDAFTSFTTVMSGGAPIPPALRDRFHDRTGIALRNVYGLTETTAPVTATPAGASPPVDPASGALSIGKAVPGATVRIAVEDDPAGAEPRGEIVVSGPSVIAGYWKSGDGSAFEGDSFRTGDVGFRDEDGWFFLVDRKKDMIIASGFKVWPREVEDVLYQHPKVKEAAVVGAPDAYRGETVRAVLSLRDGCQASEAEIIEFCRERLSAYKCPKLVSFLPDLPKTATGKILRRALR